MDVETLSRIQFALTIMFHYIYPPLSIGLGVALVLIEGLYMTTKNPAYKEAAKFWTMVFSPSTLTRLAHTLIGAWLAGAFLLISVGAYYLLHQRHHFFAKISLKTGLSIAAVSLILQLITGDQSAKIVATHQPSKL